MFLACQLYFQLDRDILNNLYKDCCFVYLSTCTCITVIHGFILGQYFKYAQPQEHHQVFWSSELQAKLLPCDRLVHDNHTQLSHVHALS